MLKNMQGGGGGRFSRFSPGSQQGPQTPPLTASPSPLQMPNASGSSGPSNLGIMNMTGSPSAQVPLTPPTPPSMGAGLGSIAPRPRPSMSMPMGNNAGMMARPFE